MTQDVFDFFDREHGLILLESEYDDIQKVVNADLCREIIGWKNNLSSANAQLSGALRERDEVREQYRLADQFAQSCLRERDEARAMVAELAKVLEPFARAFDTSGKEVFDSFANNPRMVEINDQNQILPRGTNMGHYRRAFEALAKAEAIHA